MSGERGFGVSLADPAGRKTHPPCHHEPLFFFFLIIRLKNNTLVQKKMAPPSVAAYSLISPGPSNSFIFHYNNLQMILPCSLPSYLTLVFVFSILPFFFHKCLCFMSSILETLSRNNCWVLGEHAHQRAEKYNYIL